MRISLFPQSIFSIIFSNPTHTAIHPATEDLLDYLANVAIVSDDICPFQSGRVHFQSSWWPAVCSQHIQIPSGTNVRVIGRRNITLLVEPIPNHQEQ